MRLSRRSEVFLLGISQGPFLGSIGFRADSMPSKIAAVTVRRYG